MSDAVKTGKILVLGGAGLFERSPIFQAIGEKYDVIVADSFEEALDYLRRQSFDAVLSGTADFLPLERAMVSQQSAAVLNTLGQGVCIVDVTGRTLWQNRVMAAFGSAVMEQVRRCAERAVGQFKGPDLGPPDSPARLRRFSVQADDRHYELTISPMIEGASADNIRQLAVVVWDVTDSRRLRQKIDAIDQAGRELVRLDAEALARMDMQQRFQLLEERIIRYTRDLLHFDNFGIWLVEPASKRLQLVLSDGMPSWVGDVELHVASEGNGICGYVAATGRSYICADTSRDSRYITGIEGARSSLTVPIRLHDAVIGVLNVESRQAGYFTEDDRQFVEIFGRYIAMTLNVLDLLVAERYTSTGRFARNVAGEIEQPLSEIVAQAAGLIEENVGNDELRNRLNAIIDRATAIKQTVRQVAQAPTSMLGRRQLDAGPIERDPLLADKRVLVADDDESIVKDLGQLLTQHGCRIETARDGAEATAMVKSRDYDLVLCDIRMPHANGYDIYSACKARSAAVPVILMTGFGYDPNHSIFRARQEGVFGVLFKPFKADQVLEKVRQAFQVAK